MLAATISCGEPTAPKSTTSAETAQIILSPPTQTLILGATHPLQAQAQDASGKIVSNATIFWSSSDPAIADVSATGVVTAQGIGTTQIAASAEGKSAVSVVTVVPVPVASVSVVPANVTIATGTSVALQALPYDAIGTSLSGRTIVWATSAPAIATVANDGTVTGVAAGTVSITATSEGQIGTSTVTVQQSAPPPPTTPSPGPAHHVVISAPSILMARNDVMDISARVYDANNAELTSSTITWKSSKSTVATVTSTGALTAKISAKKLGTSLITATSQGKSSTLLMTVLP
jgi:uncharacterized protein YjdB